MVTQPSGENAAGESAVVRPPMVRSPVTIQNCARSMSEVARGAVFREKWQIFIGDSSLIRHELA